MTDLNDLIEGRGGDVDEALASLPRPPHVVLLRAVVRLRHHGNRPAAQHGQLPLVVVVRRGSLGLPSHVDSVRSFPQASFIHHGW